MEPTPVISSHFLEDGEHHASLAKPIAADAPSTTAIALPIPETNSPRNQNKRSAQSRNLSLPTHQKKYVHFTIPPLPFHQRLRDPPSADAVVRVAARRKPAGGYLHGHAAANVRPRPGEERGAVQPRRRREEAERVGGDGHGAKGSGPGPR
jgi:hypothetical protein